ncbi:MAG TPA: hypothetical protein VGQ03_03275 [Nitrososphaera sp.]|jgi:hypothetical protein|nr:hypothetical protein [Nitrososphaera sp.]
MNPYAFVGMIAAALAILGAAATQSAHAANLSDGANWGEATADFAPLGEHSSSQDEPRAGLGNLAQLLGSWCGLLEFLGFPCS